MSLYLIQYASSFHNLGDITSSYLTQRIACLESLTKEEIRNRGVSHQGGKDYSEERKIRSKRIDIQSTTRLNCELAFTVGSKGLTQRLERFANDLVALPVGRLAVAAACAEPKSSTSMCASSNGLNPTLQLSVENSTRAHDSSKNQPHR